MPKLICPQNQMVELPASRDQVEVKVHRPKTDLNFKRDIRVHPSWIRRDEIVLGLGKLSTLTFLSHIELKNNFS